MECSKESEARRLMGIHIARSFPAVLCEAIAIHVAAPVVGRRMIHITTGRAEPMCCDFCHSVRQHALPAESAPEHTR